MDNVPKEAKRTFRFLDGNVAINRPPRVTRRHVADVEGQENTTKRIKLDNSAAKKHDVDKIDSQYVEASPPISEPSIQLDETYQDGVSLLISEDLENIYNVETELQRRIQISEDYCSSNCVIEAVTRGLLLNWLLKLQGAASVESEVFHLAATLLDAYLDSPTLQQCNLNSAATSAFLLSYKYYYGRVQLKSIIPNKKLSKKGVLKYERILLHNVGFNLQFPNSSSLIGYHMHRLFGGLLPSHSYYSVCYLVDFMFLHVDFVRENYNDRVAAALLTTLHLFHSHLITKFYTVIDVRIKDAAQRNHMRLIQLLNNDLGKESVLNKRYSSSKFLNITKLFTVHFSRKKQNNEL